MTEKLSFEVPPVQPSVVAQIRAGILMFIVLVAGFAIGVMGTRRKISIICLNTRKEKKGE
ncbi:hypothetical protein GCM10020331_093540 [Ectobacillus funiculus]